MAYEFDLVVIGSGPAGEKGAAQAAYFGKRVAIVEREPVLGGAAANTGTLPSKTLRETSVFLSGFRHRELEGIDFRGLKDNVTVGHFLRREQIIKQRERARIGENLKRHNIAVLQGAASLLDPHTVAVRGSDGGTTRVSGEFILIATGSAPFRPREFQFNDPRIYDSDSILALREVPRTMLVAGGGVIGSEYACMFAELGVQVTIVEKRDRLVAFLDNEIGAALQSAMRSMGMVLLTNDCIDKLDYGPRQIAVQLASGKSVPTDAILVSSGRVGNTAGLGLRQLGIAVDSRGRIQVNEYYQTAIANVYAAGDVIGGPSLASTSMQQARVAMVHAFDLQYLKGLPQILPYGIYTIPECSMAGETEESAREKGIECVVGKAAYAGNARGQIVGDRDGFLKLVFRKADMRLVGVHMIGEQATELVHIGLTALTLEAGAELFINCCYNYPTLGELYKYAAYDALGRRQSDNACPGASIPTAPLT
jgi:NAD(P) transhydrogenase